MGKVIRKILQSQLNSIKLKLEEENNEVLINPDMWDDLTPDNLYEKLHELFRFNATITKKKEYLSNDTKNSLKTVSCTSIYNSVFSSKIARFDVLNLD